MGSTRLTDPDDVVITEVPAGAVPEGPAPLTVPVTTEDGIVLIPNPGQVVDVTNPGVILRFGEIYFPATIALQALAQAGQQHGGALPAIGDIRSEQDYLAAIGDQGQVLWGGELPLMEQQIWGYQRGTSEDVLPDKIPVLADIGDLKALPGIIDPVVHRVFQDAAKAGPRLLGCTPPNTPLPSRVYVAEFPPTSVMSRVGDTFYQLNVPYVIAAYVPAFGSLFLRCRTRPVTVGDTMTNYFPFPHISDAGSVCIHIAGVNALRNAEPLEAIVQAVTAYWQTGYAYYLTTTGLEAIPGGTDQPALTTHTRTERTGVVRNFAWWEKQTFETILGLKYRNAETVEEFAIRVFAQRNGNTGTRYPMEFFIDPAAITQADTRAEIVEAQLEEMAQVAQQ